MTLKVCDRCKKKYPPGQDERQLQIIYRSSSPEFDFPINLCACCYEDLCVFLNGIAVADDYIEGGAL